MLGVDEPTHPGRARRAHRRRWRTSCWRCCAGSRSRASPSRCRGGIPTRCEPAAQASLDFSPCTSTSTSPSAPGAAATATSPSRSGAASPPSEYVEAVLTRVARLAGASGVGRLRPGRHRLFRRRHAVATRSGRTRAHRSTAVRADRSIAAGRRDHPRGQSRRRHTAGRGRLACRRRQPGVARRAVVRSRGARAGCTAPTPPSRSPRRSTPSVAAGIADLSLDLIFGLAGRRSAGAGSGDLDRALALEPSHLSLYGLTVEAAHAAGPLDGAGRGRRRWTRTGTPTEFLAAHADARRRGFEHYEVSNAGQPGPPGAPQQRLLAAGAVSSGWARRPTADSGTRPAVEPARVGGLPRGRRSGGRRRLAGHGACWTQRDRAGGALPRAPDPGRAPAGAASQSDARDRPGSPRDGPVLEGDRLRPDG